MAPGHNLEELQTHTYHTNATYQSFEKLYFWDTWNWPNDDLTTDTYKEFVAKHSFHVKCSTYSESISYEAGFFSPKVINSTFNYNRKKEVLTHC